MKIELLKTYQAPKVEILAFEPGQGVLNSMSGASDTENLNEEDFNW